MPSWIAIVALNRPMLFAAARGEAINQDVTNAPGSVQARCAVIVSHTGGAWCRPGDHQRQSTPLSLALAAAGCLAPLSWSPV